jgi:hypothetical protein
VGVSFVLYVPECSEKGVYCLCFYPVGKDNLTIIAGKCLEGMIFYYFVVYFRRVAFW